MVKKILVATDGSERAEKAAGLAIELAQACGAEFFIVSVVDSGSPRSAMDIDPDALEEIKEDNNFSDVEKIIDEKKAPEWQNCARVSESAHAANLTVTCDVRMGNPAEEIIAFAREKSADLIVLGSHGRSQLGTAVMGSVTTAILHKGDLPVLVVPVHKD
ncbi:MAG: universal stress protein [Thermoleophilia bacterium]